MQRVYVKDVSLELPNAPQSFLEKGELHTQLDLVAESTALDNVSFETALRATLTAKVNDKILYVLEIKQAGIFVAQNIPQNILDQLLAIQAPAALTAYLRSNVSDVLTRATLPMFFLPEINWAQSYQERAAREQEAAAGIVGTDQVAANA